jgi:hypothetical protein
MVDSQAGDWPISSGGEGATIGDKYQKMADHANGFRRKKPNRLWRKLPISEKSNKNSLRNG